MWIKSSVSQEWRRPPSSPILRCRCGHSAMEDVLEKRLFPLSSEISLLKCEVLPILLDRATFCYDRYLQSFYLVPPSSSHDMFQVSCKYWNVFLFEVDDLHTSEFCQATFVILIPD
ncbi:hypothetical protein EJB05_16101, partial [Eragrostis curvula]